MWKEIYEDYILLDLGNYVDGMAGFHISVLLLVLAVGLCAACVAVNYHRAYMGLFLKQLLRAEAIDEKSARTLDELRIGRAYGLRAALSRNGQLAKLVRRVGEVKLSYEEYMEKLRAKEPVSEKIDFSAARFYIPEETIDRAKHFYEKDGASTLKTVLSCLLILAFFVGLVFLMPSLLTFVTGI